MSRLEQRIKLSSQVRQGKVLLVGERVNYRPGEAHRPWCTDRGCSGWLNRLLDEAEVDESGLVWANALDEWGRSVDLKKLVGILNPRVIIALGRTAHDALDEAGLKNHYFMSHPQYWMRFASRNPYPLITLLKRLEAEDGTI